MNNVLEGGLFAYVSYLRAMQLWFHGAHNLTKGTGFAGDHVNLYGMIYNNIHEELDGALEKAIGLTQSEKVACPIGVTSSALEVLNAFPSPSGSSALNIASVGLQLELSYLAMVEELYHTLKNSGDLTLGLDDFLMQSANQHEEYVYLLQQRVKSDLN